ncbi:unnamed protein product, partial [Owenia fusiformis]
KRMMSPLEITARWMDGRTDRRSRLLNDKMASLWNLTAFTLMVIFIEYGNCSDIMEVQWNGKNVQIFNRPTAIFGESQDCLPGFFKGIWQNESCYMFVLTGMSRSEAAAFCTEAAVGNGLVAVENELDQSYIVAQIVMQPELRTPVSDPAENNNNNYWTSAENIIDGTWRWGTTQAAMNYTKFYEENPYASGYLTLWDNTRETPPSFFDWWIMPQGSAYALVTFDLQQPFGGPSFQKPIGKYAA